MTHQTYIVRVFRDVEANVWCASSFNFVGLATDAPTIEGLLEKIPPMIIDLIETDRQINSDEIPLQLLVENTAIVHRNCA